MSTQAIIEEKLNTQLNPEHLQVINESSNHNVPEGSESHFKVVVVSNKFSEKSLINRHRIINEILQDELAGKIHALAIHAYTAEDWSEKNKQAPDSPDCKGGDGTFKNA